MKLIFFLVLFLAFCQNLRAEDVSLKIAEVIEPDGRTRYDLHFDGGFHSFWSFEELEKFGTHKEKGCEFDCSDDEATKNRRLIMKSYIEANGVSKTVSDLKTKEKTFTVLKSEPIVQEKLSV